MSEVVKWHEVYGPRPEQAVDMGSSRCAPEPPFWVFDGSLSGACWLHPTEARVLVSMKYGREIAAALSAECVCGEPASDHGRDGCAVCKDSQEPWAGGGCKVFRLKPADSKSTASDAKE